MCKCCSKAVQVRAIGAITKRTIGATDGPKSLKGFCTYVLPVSCGQIGRLPQG